MRCPRCDAASTGVTDSRSAAKNGEATAFVYRRRRCPGCGLKFSTYELPAKPGFSLARDAKPWLRPGAGVRG